VVLPGGSTVAGKTIGQWTADWWNWAGSISPNVFVDTTGALATKNQSGPVFFVAGTSGGPAVTRSFTIPANKFVLFPLINWYTGNGADPGFASTAEEAGALVDGTVDVSKLFATVDGTTIPDLGSHREKSPVNFTATYVANSTGFPPGTYTDSNSDGYWIMLEPLGPGEHTLHFGGTTKDFTGPDPAISIASFTVDATDHVTVAATAVPLPTAVVAGAPMLLAMIGFMQWRRARTIVRG
jgi:hypothetical protein